MGLVRKLREWSDDGSTGGCVGFASGFSGRQLGQRGLLRPLGVPELRRPGLPVQPLRLPPGPQFSPIKQTEARCGDRRQDSRTESGFGVARCWLIGAADVAPARRRAFGLTRRLLPPCAPMEPSRVRSHAVDLVEQLNESLRLTSRDIWTMVTTPLAHARSDQQSKTHMTLVVLWRPGVSWRAQGLNCFARPHRVHCSGFVRKIASPAPGWRA